MRILGLIPARGGSKGVPNKNIRLLGGKPLLCYTAESALEAACLDRTIVSTDSMEIKKIAISAGVEVPFLRPAELAGDTTPSLDVILHALDWMEGRGDLFDAVCLLQPTSPFRAPGFIAEAVRIFREAQCDALVSVRRVPDEFNPHWTFEVNDEGFLRVATGEATIVTRRQDLPSAYFRDGSLYLTRTSVLREKRSLYGDSVLPIEVVGEDFVNIDTLADWQMAEDIVARRTTK